MEPTTETVLDEAKRLVFGDREAAYSHPRDDFERVAMMLNGLLKHKLRSPLDAADWAYIMIICKLARQSYMPKRDNLVDIAGYAECAARVLGEDK